MGLLLISVSWCGALPSHLELLGSNGYENERPSDIRGDAVNWCKGLLWPLTLVTIIWNTRARHNRRARGYRVDITVNRKRILIFMASCLQVHAAPPEIAGGFNSDDGTDEPGSPVYSIPGGDDDALVGHADNAQVASAALAAWQRLGSTTDDHTTQAPRAGQTGCGDRSRTHRHERTPTSTSEHAASQSYGSRLRGQIPRI
jgi:hypothetical protein